MARNKQFESIQCGGSKTIYDPFPMRCSAIPTGLSYAPRALQPFLSVMWRVVAIVSAITP